MSSISFESFHGNGGSYCVHADSFCAKLRFVSCGTCYERQLSEEISNEYIEYQMGPNKGWRPFPQDLIFYDDGGQQNYLSEYLGFQLGSSNHHERHEPDWLDMSLSF